MVLVESSAAASSVPASSAARCNVMVLVSRPRRLGNRRLISVFRSSTSSARERSLVNATSPSFFTHSVRSWGANAARRVRGVIERASAATCRLSHRAGPPIACGTTGSTWTALRRIAHSRDAARDAQEKATVQARGQKLGRMQS